MLTDEQLLLRKQGIGGSEISVLMGFDNDSTPLDIYRDKINPEIIRIPENKYMRAGNKHEPMIAEYFTEETGIKLYKQEPPTIVDGILVTSPDYLYDNGVLECKFTTLYLDEPVNKWICQANWYAGNLQREKISIAWLERGFDFKFRIYNFNPELYKLQIENANTFWNNHILHNKPPEPINRADIEYLYPNATNSTVNACNELYYEYLKLVELTNINKANDKIIDKLKNNILLALRNSETLVYGDLKLATYKNTKSALYFDEDSFKKENNELYLQYLKNKNPQRRLLIK